MSENIKMKDLSKTTECFSEHDVEEIRYEHHMDEANVEYECNTCGRRISLSYKLDGVSVSEGKL